MAENVHLPWRNNLHRLLLELFHRFDHSVIAKIGRNLGGSHSIAAASNHEQARCSSRRGRLDSRYLAARSAISGHLQAAASEHPPSGAHYHFQHWSYVSNFQMRYRNFN